MSAIVDLVEQYVPTLEGDGHRYKGLCPFHEETSPSFTVNAENGRWHCYGECRMSGDVLEFIRHVEAAELLPDAP
tara:strand:- start:23 stop:247 length:225 start_codon:yes stop_codon:yes gene_type:complete